MMMLDSIDALEYSDLSVRFPQLRNRRLINSDFFAEDYEGFRTMHQLLPKGLKIEHDNFVVKYQGL